MYISTALEEIKSRDSSRRTHQVWLYSIRKWYKRNQICNRIRTIGGYLFFISNKIESNFTE